MEIGSVTTNHKSILVPPSSLALTSFNKSTREADPSRTPDEIQGLLLRARGLAALYATLREDGPKLLSLSYKEAHLQLEQTISPFIGDETRAYQGCELKKAARRAAECISRVQRVAKLIGKEVTISNENRAEVLASIQQDQDDKLKAALLEVLSIPQASPLHLQATAFGILVRFLPDAQIPWLRPGRAGVALTWAPIAFASQDPSVATHECFHLFCSIAAERSAPCAALDPQDVTSLCCALEEAVFNEEREEILACLVGARKLPRVRTHPFPQAWRAWLESAELAPAAGGDMQAALITSCQQTAVRVRQFAVFAKELIGSPAISKDFAIGMLLASGWDNWQELARMHGTPDLDTLVSGSANNAFEAFLKACSPLMRDQQKDEDRAKNHAGITALSDYLSLYPREQLGAFSRIIDGLDPLRIPRETVTDILSYLDIMLSSATIGDDELNAVGKSLASLASGLRQPIIGLHAKRFSHPSCNPEQSNLDRRLRVLLADDARYRRRYEDLAVIHHLQRQVDQLRKFSTHSSMGKGWGLPAISGADRSTFDKDDIASILRLFCEERDPRILRGHDSHCVDGLPLNPESIDLRARLTATLFTLPVEYFYLNSDFRCWQWHMGTALFNATRWLRHSRWLVNGAAVYSNGTACDSTSFEKAVESCERHLASVFGLPPERLSTDPDVLVGTWRLLTSDGFGRERPILSPNTPVHEWLLLWESAAAKEKHAREVGRTNRL